MKTLLSILSEEMGKAFEAAGYDAELGKVGVSNRPDLCEYQCNGAMAGAKKYHKAPLQIATDVAANLESSEIFEKSEAVAPGFLNLNLKGEFVAKILSEMTDDEFFGLERPEPLTMVVDYGGPNVAKPLHVGHLRSAVIGESIKRILRYMGHTVYGDIHMGDWGLQMGLVIYEMSLRMPELPYFDDAFTGEYPAEAPFTVTDLEEIYPAASKKSKEDADYKAKAMEATLKLQEGKRGYRALWERIMDVSIVDMKRNYSRLNVDFDLWNGESTVQDLIPGMVKDMKDGGFAYESNGAIVVDVKEETDTKEMPPCIIIKSDGASLYNTTDLATIKDRVAKYNPAKMVYLTDKRQDLYFEQVFRCARKTGLVSADTELVHIGFGTVNGKDGSPYKTRSGGVPRLSDLIDEIEEGMHSKIAENANTKGDNLTEDEINDRARKVGLAAIKYGDLSNQASKDYIFDKDRFISFEGDTGPYILYTIVRIKSILDKHTANGGKAERGVIGAAGSKEEKDLQMLLAGYNATMESAAAELAPHKICGYIYDIANAFNRFYHETQILAEPDEARKQSLISLLVLTGDILETCIDLLGFSAPERM
ncbi:MAG: arginine--tRNA ligase [Lachnospiraceae bacterium]|nr:arginine--tRNA ligase [Lachnospiraceae bacterium]